MYSNPQNERKVNLLRLSKNWLKAVEVVGWDTAPFWS
jgi:hypothetical protein